MDPMDVGSAPSSPSMSVTPPTKVCSHLSTISGFAFLKRRFSAIDLKHPSCSMCGVEEEEQIWACLEDNCKFIGCGRRTRNRHALLHFTQYNQDEILIRQNDYHHCVCINLKSGMIWCYACDMEIIETPSEEQSKLLNAVREMLLPSASAKSEAAEKSKANSMDKGLCGLANLGNTCYMNAALQALSHCMPLTMHFCNCSPTSHLSSRSVNLSRTYAQLAQALWSGQYKSVAPTQFVREITDINALFRSFGQQDTQEFLRTLLDRLHEELKVADPNHVFGFTPLPAPFPNGSSHAKKPKHYVSVISDIFEGVLLSRVKCLECNKDSLTKDKFYDLSVSIPDKRTLGRLQQTHDSMDLDSPSTSYTAGWLSTIGYYLGLVRRTVTLEQCLWSFFSTEDLVGNDKYSCEFCKQLNDGEKTFSLDRLPEILCIHVKRFRYDSYFSSKISDQVIFPLKDLNVRPFCTQDLCNNETNMLYDLVAVINHRGGLSGGHYVSYAYNERTKAWYEFDDRQVSEVSSEEVQNVEAYVLFYQRKVSDDRREEIKRICSLKKEKRGVDPEYLIPTAWYYKWKSSSHPGPIDTSRFLCEHGILNQDHMEFTQLTPIPKSVWDELYSIYGGGPVLIPSPKCAQCEAERLQLEERRQREKREVNDLNSLEMKKDEPYFLIHSDWLYSWHQFCEGASLPGPISNHLLLDEQGKPKLGLRKSEHYRGVNQSVWEYFHEKYGGGPVICRPSVNIYCTQES